MVRSVSPSYIVFAGTLALAGVSDAFTTMNPPSVHPTFVRSHSRTRGPLSNDASTTQLSAFAMEGVDVMGNFLQAQPYLSAFLCCAAKASAADMVAQTSSQPHNDDHEEFIFPQLNLPRNLAFLAYGGIYQGMVQTFIFGTLFPAVFGTEPTVSSVLSQVAIDLLILGPMVCMPTVYSMKALFAGQEASAGIAKYMDDVQNQGLLFKYWGLWAPVQTLNFAFVPAELRVYFVAAVSFFWICVLSNISSNNAAPEAKQKISQPTAAQLRFLGLHRPTMPVPVPVGVGAQSS